MGKVKFGLKNVHIAPITEDGFDTIFAVEGAVNLSLDQQGDMETFYADNIKYYVSANNNGYEGSLELANVPDEFRTKILKEVLDTKKVLSEKVGVEFAKFALGFEIGGDAKANLYWFTNCSVTRPSVNGQTTEDSKTPQTETLNISCSSDADGVVRYVTTEQTDDSTRLTWFDSVYGA